MVDINVKLLLDNKVVMGGSGQEIRMGKMSMLNTAYDLQWYEGSDRDDDDNDDLTVHNDGDDNDDGGDDNYDGGDDNDQQLEGNEYGADEDDIGRYML